jgi:hypothetical protein
MTVTIESWKRYEYDGIDLLRVDEKYGANQALARDSYLAPRPERESLPAAPFELGDGNPPLSGPRKDSRSSVGEDPRRTLEVSAQEVHFSDHRCRPGRVDCFAQRTLQLFP